MVAAIRAFLKIKTFGTSWNFGFIKAKPIVVIYELLAAFLRKSYYNRKTLI